MVGIEKIREYLGAFNTNYVIIGGTAYNLNMEEADLQGRATKDIDMIVVCEAINTNYVKQFWKFIKAGGYKVCQVNTDNERIRKSYCRFTEPSDSSFPAYIELFSRIPDGITIPEDAHLVHINLDKEYTSSFSAILMDDDYYNYAVSHSIEIQGINVLDKDALIVLKAKAYLNNLKRKEKGQSVHQEDIDKHKKDLYRISFLFSGEERYYVSDNIKADLKDFITKLYKNPISTKAIAKTMGVVEVPMSTFVQKINTLFHL